MAISVAQARQICTQSELDLVLQSTTRQIGSLDAKQLRSSIRRARTLRDKWRDRAASQTRDTKSQNPDKLGEANARSSDKAQLFEEALGRFEKRLSRVDGTTNGAAAASKTKPAKQARTSAHRATRASVRSTLSKQAGKSDAAAPASARAANAATAKAAAPGETATTAAAATAASKRTVAKKGSSTKVSAKRKGPPKRKAAPSSSTSAVPTATAPVAPGLAAAAMAAGRDSATASTAGTKKRKSPTNAAAKTTAAKPGGGPRMSGNVAAQGRRSQAKRGSR